MKPSLFFLCETRKRDINKDHWRIMLGFKGCFVVDSRGRSGGLCLLWGAQLDVDIKSYSNGHIDCIVRHDEIKWRFTGFYGNPDTSLRHTSWDLIRRLAGMHELREFQWLLGGDFNEICYDSEKLGGNRRPAAQIEAFRCALDDCNLQSLHCEGDIFTWVNRRNNDGLIFERLDKYVRSFEWRMMFPTAKCTALDFYHSNHRSICIQLGSSGQLGPMGNRFGQRPFRFEPMWIRDSECESVITESWRGPNVDADLHERIRLCSMNLQQWAQRRFRYILQKIQNSREQLERIRNHECWHDEMNNIQELENEIEKLSFQEKLFWKQCSRVDWFSSGNKNTKFFHRAASLRKAHNTISGLISSHGEFVQEPRGMAAIINDYFACLFTSSDPQLETMQPVIDCVEPKVSNEMNTILGAPFTGSDIKAALFDMSLDKAPGPDELSALFYQKYWHIIGEDVTKAALKVLNENESMERWNTTIITLISKVSNLMMVKEFRPISLCNTCYKIIARALTNHLRLLMRFVIDESQSAFVPGRLISDNVILGFKAIHWIRA